MKVLVAQSCLILCDPMDGSPPGSSVHGISQARILEWVAISSFRGFSWSRNQIQVSCIAGVFSTSWATRQAPLLSWTYHLIPHIQSDLFFTVLPEWDTANIYQEKKGKESKLNDLNQQFQGFVCVFLLLNVSFAYGLPCWHEHARKSNGGGL